MYELFSIPRKPRLIILLFIFESQYRIHPGRLQRGDQAGDRTGYYQQDHCTDSNSHIYLGVIEIIRFEVIGYHDIIDRTNDQGSGDQA